MNEVKHIHLGRQSFTISVDAYRLLRAYLEAIKVQVGAKGNDVNDEVELRLAELLTERGIDGEKVILPKDVTYLKEQLGEPRDFKDEEDEHAEHIAEPGDAPKRLFRDPEQAMIAGVAAGVASYLGIDPTVVRLIFVALTFLGGSGILIYIILWLVVPEAQTSSERLQMRGKAVTVDSLKEVIDRADIAGAANRATKTGRAIGQGAGRVVARAVESFTKTVLAIVGVSLVVAACCLFLSTTTAGVYLLMRGAQIGTEVVFPVGSEAVAGLFCALVVLFAIVFLIMIAGLTMIRRKAVVRGWVVAAAAGVILVGAGLGTAIGLDIAPSIQAKWQAMHHTQTTQVQPFTKVNLTGDRVNFTFVQDKNYAVDVQYFGDSHQVQGVSEQVANSTLTIDMSKYQGEDKVCKHICLFTGTWPTVVIHAPSLQAATVAGQNASLNLAGGDATADTFTLTVAGGAEASLDEVRAAQIAIELGQADGSDRITLQGISPQAGNGLSVAGDTLLIGQTSELDLNTNGSTCQPFSPAVNVQSAPAKLSINGKAVQTPIAASLSLLANPAAPNDYNCVSVSPSDASLPAVPTPASGN